MSALSEKLKTLAIVILAYSDYESLELTLAVHAKFLPYLNEGKRIKIYILQNGRGTYDCERTYKVAKRYEDLFPKDIEVVDWIAGGIPYFSIKKLFQSPNFSDITHVIKLDDDVFPLTVDWVESLWKCYQVSEEKYGEKLAYVTSLVNNNPWGFEKTLNLMGLRAEYFQKIARDHFVGDSEENPFSPYRFCPKDMISTGGHGTVWKLPYISRWLHKNTTLQPGVFIQKTRNAGYEEVFSKERYSINCMLFAKDYWEKISNGGHDDELMSQIYCINNNLKIVANLEVPMCHLFFFTQRSENYDLIDVFKDYYSHWLNLPFPISIKQNRQQEIEDRLRFLEKALGSNSIFHYSPPQKRIDYIKGKLRRYPSLYRVARAIYKKLS